MKSPMCYGLVSLVYHQLTPLLGLTIEQATEFDNVFLMRLC